MSRSPSLLPGPRTTAVLLVVAPLLEVAELSLSPLDGSSTRKDLVAIAAHQGRFELSVVLGVLGTLCFAPAFLGLAAACASAGPRLARAAGWIAVASMGGFMGIRMSQAIELAGIQQHLDVHDLAATIDHAPATPIGALIAVVFLLGALVGTILLAVVAWRAGLPKVACVLLAVFQVVDLVTPPRPPVSHLLLLVSLGWIAVVLWCGAPVSIPEQDSQPVAV
jgi:uncharacterized membrane protein YhaH (DUF805 family)